MVGQFGAITFVDGHGSKTAANRARIAISSATPAVSAALIDAAPPPAQAPPQRSNARSLRELEKEGILAALAATSGNKAQAAAILEIDRSTLYKKLKDYDIEG
jgi:DNA-binding NtrC family response regulator